MVARAVMKAWQDSLGDVPPVGRVYRRGSEGGNVGRESCGWRPPVDADQDVLRTNDGDSHLASHDDDDDGDDPPIRVGRRGNIVPRRPGAPARGAAEESLWASHMFWKGVVVGAAIVFLIKTVLAVRTPHGIDWYGF